MSKKSALSKTINIEYTQVGHIVMLDYDDWLLLTDWLRGRGVSIKERSVKKNTVRVDKRN